jgi:CheY-like chemotaxis protein
MKPSLRVLLIEDTEDDAQLLLHELERGFSVTHRRVLTSNAMQEALDEAPWDLAICDWTLPQFSAPEALALLLKRNADLPFIIVSGSITEEIAVHAIKAGAHDFVLKDRLARLMPAVERELREVQVRRSARTARQALERSERLLGHVTESVSEAIVAFGMDGEILLWNAAARRIFGGQHLLDASGTWDGHTGLYLPDGRTECPRKDGPIARALRGESVEAQELAVPDRDSGAALRVVASARPMQDDDGRQWGALAVIRECRDPASGS